MNRHVPAQRRGELSSESKVSLIHDFESIIELRVLFQSQIQHHYDFAIDTTMPIDAVIQHSESVQTRLNSESPIRKEFKRDRQAYVDAKDFLKRTKKRSYTELTQYSQGLDPDSLEDKDLDTIENSAKKLRKELFQAKKAVTDVGAGIIATYWHSEQRLLYHLGKQATDIFKPILEGMSTPPEALILCLHSRFDICKVCSHSLAHSCRTPEEHLSTSSTNAPEAGILFELKKVMSDHFNLTSADFPFLITSSFREGRKDFDFNKEAKVELRDSTDLLQRLPAFPMCYIPSELLPSDSVK